MRWFRRHRRYLLAGVVVMLMASWGILGTVQRLVRSEEPPLGVVRGEKVTVAEGREAASVVRMANALRFFSPMTLQALQYSPGPVEAKRMVAALGMTFFRFIDAGRQEGRDESPWRTVILLREADAAGIQVTDEEARELLKMSPVMMSYEGFSTESYRMFRQSYGLSDTEMARLMRQMAKIAKLLMIRRDGISASRAELWADWVFGEEQLKVALAAVDAKWFERFVDPTEEELHTYYEEHKDQIPDEAAGTVGFKAPERVRIEYAAADPEAFAAEAQVSDEEAAAYYEDHKAEFLADEGESAEETETAAEGNAGEAADEQSEPQYVPLAEVKGEIRDTLAEEKGREAARDAVRRVMTGLEAVSPDYANDRQPLAQMARRNGLTPVVAEAPDGTQLLSRQEVAELVPQGASVASFAFEQPEVLFFPHLMDQGSPPLVCQVIEQRAPEVKPYAEVEAQAREWYIREAALKQAETFARKTLDAAKEQGLRPAVADMDVRLRELLALGEAEAPLLQVQESGFFTRGARRIPGVEGGGAAVVATEAFSLPRGEIGLVSAGAPDYACYVLQVTDSQDASRKEFAESNPMMRAFYIGDKQQRVLSEWLESLLAAAKPDPRAALWQRSSDSKG